MQGKVLSLSYPAIMFIHFELAELSDSWVSLVPVVSVSTSTMFLEISSTGFCSFIYSFPIKGKLSQFQNLLALYKYEKDTYLLEK